MQFFVNYDGDLCLHNYVNFVAAVCIFLYHFQLFLNILRLERTFYTKYSSCKKACKIYMVGKYHLPTTDICTT